MKHLLVATFAVCLAAATAGAQRRNREAPPALQHGTFATHRFASAAQDGAEVPYGVYLPRSYGDEANRDRRYPLVIWLHGMWEDHEDFHFRGGTAVLDRMIGAGEVPEMVFVTANGGRSSFYINGASGAFEDLITKDLLAHVEQQYRVASDRRLRALLGTSMGGNGALRIGLTLPQLFGVVAAHSAAVLPRDPAALDEAFPWLRERGGGRRALAAVFGDPFDRAVWDANNLLLVVEKLEPERLAGLRLYLDCGDQDRYGFAAPNRELHELLSAREIPHTWRSVEDGNHGWGSGYNQAELPHSLRFAAAAWAAAQGATSPEEQSRDREAGEKGGTEKGGTKPKGQTQ